MNEIEEELLKIKKIFSKKSIEELPCIPVSEIYNKLMGTYKSPIAGLVGVYLLGTIHGSKDT